MKLSLFIALSVFSLSLHALECDLKSHKELGAEVLKALNDAPIQCNPNPVHLTFEDGPSASVTPAILRELALRQTKASFFVSTSHITSKPIADIISQTMDQGHLVGSHGHDRKSHSLRMNQDGEILETGLTQVEREEQIQVSVSLLNKVTNGRFSKQSQLLFRLPYGRGAMPSGKELKSMMSSGEISLQGRTYAEQLSEYRQISPALQTLAGNNFSHLGWNLDSGDSNFETKAPESAKIKEYILKTIGDLCSSPKMTKVILFNDTKEINISAIPVIMDIGKCLGVKFVSSQEMAKDALVKKFGVLIEKDTIKIANVKQIIIGMDTIKKLGAQCEDIKPDSTCSAEGRNFLSCEGNTSICFEGKWYAKTDPIITNHCK